MQMRGRCGPGSRPIWLSGCGGWLRIVADWCRCVRSAHVLLTVWLGLRVCQRSCLSHLSVYSSVYPTERVSGGGGSEVGIARCLFRSERTAIGGRATSLRTTFSALHLVPASNSSGNWNREWAEARSASRSAWDEGSMCLRLGRGWAGPSRATHEGQKTFASSSILWQNYWTWRTGKIKVFWFKGN